MKRFYCLIVFAWNLSAMSEVSAQPFIRIYDHHGRKTGKGTVEWVADTVLVIKNDEKQLQRFLVTEISFIKTKRSMGTSVGLGFCVGFFGSIWIMRQAEENFDADDHALGIIMISGIAAGTVGGAISGIVTKREKFVINGDIEKWKALEGQLLAMPANDIFR